MNPYDRRAVREVWARVRPGQDVFGPWPPRPGPGPSVGQGGKPPAIGPLPPPPAPEARRAADTLAALASGYDDLSRRMRAPWLRRLAAQCRRNLDALRKCAGVQGREIPDTRATLCAQRGRERELRELLDRLDGPCREESARLRRDSAGRTRMLSRLR